MARPLRVDVPGGRYHVTARGNERKAVFRDDKDRRRFVERLEELVDRFEVAVHASISVIPPLPLGALYKKFQHADRLPCKSYAGRFPLDIVFR
jgi:hypothetical protein